MTISITHYSGRTCAYDITLTDANGDDIVLSGGDKIRAKIWREDDTPLLDLVSGTPTANGSSVSATNPTRLNLHQDDVQFTPGIYSIEVAIVDASESSAIKHADTGVFVLHKTPGGNVS